MLNLMCHTFINFRESNCFMVPSKAEERLLERMLHRKEPICVTESEDNITTTYENVKNAANEANENLSTSLAETTTTRKVYEKLDFIG